MNTKKIFVAGSTWPEDEKVVLPAFVKVASLWSLVLAPHEISEVKLNELEDFFKQNQLITCRLSQVLADKNPHTWDVLIVDLYGYLFYLYDWAQLAFVGGSFRAKVHSVMEALSYFKPVCVGPLHTNNREAIEFAEIPIKAIPLNWVQPFNNSNELESLFLKLGDLTPDQNQNLALQASELLGQRQGSTIKVYDQIQSYL